jgi:hypothetical protein
LTFYNIIFGILFLCAVRELLQAWFDREWVRFWMSVALTLLISNDILFTSHLIEERHVPYSIAMKLSDLVNFVLLSMAVLMLSPRGNLLGVDAQRGEMHGGSSPHHLRREPSFWGLICAYWGICLLWDILGGAYDGDHLVWRRSIPYLFFLPLVSIWCLSLGLPRGRLIRWARPAVAVLTALYFLGFKAPEINSLQREAADSARQHRFGGSPAPRYNARATTATRSDR